MTFFEKCIHLRAKYIANIPLSFIKLHILLQFFSTAFWDISNELPLTHSFTIDCSALSYLKDSILETAIHNVLKDLGYSCFTTRLELEDENCVHITIHE